MTTALVPKSCSAFAATWADNYPRPDDATNATRRSMIRVFAAHFGDKPLDKVYRADAREFAIKYPSHARYARELMSDAVNDGLRRSNPFIGLRLPRSRPHREVVIPSDEQIVALDEAAQENGLGSVVVFAAYTGVRKGEALGLRYDDLLGSDRVQIERQKCEDGRTTPPKEDSTGVIWVPPAAQEIVGTEHSDGRIWALSHGQFNRRWVATRKAAGLPSLRFHDLRHRCATWLIDQGCSAEDVAIQLRHADGGTQVRRTYGHPDRGLALDRLAERAA